MILSAQELVELTGRQRKDAQVRVLKFMGIEHKVRPDGTVAVLKAHVERVLGGEVYGKVAVETEPDWSRL